MPISHSETDTPKNGGFLYVRIARYALNVRYVRYRGFPPLCNNYDRHTGVGAVK